MSAARSALVAVAGNGGTQVVRLASNLILTRLLFPEAFGLMALVAVTIQGLQMVSDVGVVPAIVQHKRGEERAFLDTAWTVNAIRGVVLFLLSSLLAWPFSVLYEQPELLRLVPVVALTAIFQGLESTKLAVAIRRMTNGRLVLLDLGTQIIALLVNIALAWQFHSVWALVAGNVVGAAAKAAGSQLLLPGPIDRPRLERETIEALVSFGKWVLVSTLLTFLALRLDVLILGKLLSIDELGVYSLATVLAALPSTLSAVVIGAVVAPVLARSAREGDASLRASFAQSMGFILPATALLALSTGLGAPAFFGILYDDRYHDAGWITLLLMAQVWFTSLHELASRAFVSIGQSRPLVPANAIKLVVSVASAVAGHVLFGLPGFILGNALGSVAGFTLLAAGLRREHLYLLRVGALWSVALLAFGVAGGLATAPLAAATGLTPVVASIVVGAAAIGSFVAVAAPGALRRYREGRKSAPTPSPPASPEAGVG